MADNQNFAKLFSQLDSVLAQSDISDVSAESTGFQELPDGYYLTEVEKVELKESKSSHMPMVAFQFKVTEDGLDVQADNKNELHIKEIKKTKNRKIFKYYVLKDETSVRRFVTDMLKFEGETAGEPLLPKEAFTTSETINDAVDILIGMRIYIQVSTSENDNGEKSVWQSLISWKRAAVLELPI